MMCMQVKNIKDQATKSLQKGGEIRIPMGKTHTPKTKNFISYYKKEKTMKSSLKSKESLHNVGLSHRSFLAENLCNLRPTKTQQNADFSRKKKKGKAFLSQTAKREKQRPQVNQASLKKNSTSSNKCPLMLTAKGRNNLEA